jgi:hypothetical protein
VHPIPNPSVFSFIINIAPISQTYQFAIILLTILADMPSSTSAFAGTALAATESLPDTVDEATRKCWGEERDENEKLADQWYNWTRETPVHSCATKFNPGQTQEYLTSSPEERNQGLKAYYQAKKTAEKATSKLELTASIDRIRQAEQSVSFCTVVDF